MGQIIFARTRWIYDSYVDFWRLVELSEFPTVYVDEIDFQSDNLYITAPMNGDYRAHLANHAHDRKCTLAHWLLERPTPEGRESPADAIRRYTDANRELEAMRYVDQTIVSDPLLAKITGFKYVPMGSHALLGEPGNDKQCDFIGLMAPYPRRAFLFDGGRVKTEWNGMTFAPNVNGIKDPGIRHGFLQKARFGLNVHNDVHPFCEPLRFALFAAYALPVVTETIPDGTLYRGAIYEAHYDDIPHAMRYAADHFDSWPGAGKYLHDVMTGSHSFRRCIEGSL